MSSDGIGSTLSISLFFGVIGVIVFIFMRRAFQSFYVPKCYDPELEEEFIPNPKDCTGYLDWLSYTYHYPEEKIFRQYGGFDAVIYLRWLKYCFYYFLGNTIFTCVFLIPVYATAENHKKKSSDTGYVDGIDIISLANVEQGSKRLWATMMSIFVITGITLYFVWKNYKICMDFNILEAHKSRSQSRTVMVAELPSSIKTDQDLLDMFSKIYRKQVVLAHIVPRCTKLRKLQKERSELYKKWKIYNELYEINPMQRPTMDTFAVKIPLIGQELDLGLIPKIGKQVDALKFYEEAIFLLDKKIAYKQAHITKLTKVAFVTFANVPTAMSCSQTQHHKNRDKMIIKRAPDPEIINWANLGVSRREQYSRLLVSAGMMVGLFLFWTIPVSFLSAFSNLETLSNVDGLSFLVVLVSQNSYVQGFVEDFLPTFFLSLFMSLLPDILRFILSQTKYHLKTEEENGVLKSYWTFLLLNVFLVSTIAGSITSILDEIIGDYTKIPVLLSNSLPGQAIFFINYIIADGYRNYPFVLGRYTDFVIAKIKQRFWCETPSEKQDAEDPGGFEYSESLPSEMLVFMIGLVYSSMQPLILPFATIYFAMAYFTSKYNFIFLYKAEYEGQRVTGSIVNFTIVSLLIYHATFIGLFALKLFPYAAFVLIPMIITLLCTFYFQKVYKTATKFVPLCDCPIDKATVSELIDVIAMYTDPAMKPPPKYKGEEDIIITDQDQFVDDDALKLPKETLRMAFGAVKSVASKVQKSATTAVSTATNTVNTAVNTAASTVVSLPGSTASQLKQLARFAKQSSQTQEEEEQQQDNQVTEQNNSNNSAQV